VLSLHCQHHNSDGADGHKSLQLTFKRDIVAVRTEVITSAYVSQRPDNNKRELSRSCSMIDASKEQDVISNAYRYFDTHFSDTLYTDNRYSLTLTMTVKLTKNSVYIYSGLLSCRNSGSSDCQKSSVLPMILANSKTVEDLLREVAIQEFADRSHWPFNCIKKLLIHVTYTMLLTPMSRLFESSGIISKLVQSLTEPSIVVEH